MTLDEAIKHCEEIAMDKTNLACTLWDSKEKARCEDCANEYRQIAGWLKDYKRLTDVLDKIRTEIMSKDGLEEALEIIDKYKAESEVQE